MWTRRVACAILSSCVVLVVACNQSDVATKPTDTNSAAAPAQPAAPAVSPANAAKPEKRFTVASAGSLASAAAGMSLLQDAYDFWGNIPKTSEEPAQKPAPQPAKTNAVSDEDQQRYKNIMEEFEATQKRFEGLASPKTLPGGTSFIDEEMGYGFAINPGFGLAAPAMADITMSGQSAKMKVYVLNSNADASCIAAMFHIPFDMAVGTDANKLLENGVNELLSRWKVGDTPMQLRQVARSQPMNYEFSQGHQWYMELSNGNRTWYSRIEVYLKGMHLCTMIYTDTTAESLDGEMSNAFFESLKLY